MEEEEKDSEKPKLEGENADERDGTRGDNKDKLKTNLEILLSQNDILPLLKKIHKDKIRQNGTVSLAKYLNKIEKVILNAS